MGKKNRRNIIKIPPKIRPHEEYDLRQNFSRLNQYRSSNTYQTDTNNEQSEYQAPINSNLRQDTFSAIETTGTIGDTYFRLEDKISALSDKNDTAHNSLRKELEGKIDGVRQDVEKHSQNIQLYRRWIIGIAVTIIITIVGYFIRSYQKINDIHEDVIKIQTTIDENIKPSLEQGGKAIEQNTKDIKTNTEKIFQLQNQPQRKVK